MRRGPWLGLARPSPSPSPIALALALALSPHEELEQHVQLRELELLQLRGAHPAVQMGACRGHERSSPSGEARAGCMSVGH